MLPSKLVLPIIIFLNVTAAYSEDLPPIFISPNPYKVNIKLHSGNIETIDMSKNNSSSSLGEILKGKTNLSLSQSGGIASQNQLRMRGGEANHVLVLIDGIEVNDASSGSEYDFSHLFTFNIKSIEILSGAYSSVHGADALSGVINIKTKNTNALNITVGSNNTNIKNYSLAGETKALQYGVDLNLIESSGIDTSGTSGDRNRYENDNVRVNIKSINHEFTALYFDIFRQNDRNASGHVTDNQNATTDINQIYSQYLYKKSFSKDIYSKQGVQYSINKNVDFGPADAKWESTTQSEKLKIFSNTSIDLKNILNSKYRPSLSLGLEYEKINFTQLVLDQQYGDGNQKQREYSGSYSAEILYPIDNFQFEASGKRSINQKFSNNKSHRVGVSYKLNNGKLFFNHSTAYKNPSFTERYGYYAGTFIGNPDLKPESARQYEAGYSFESIDKNLNISQTYYNMKLKNEINGFVAIGGGNYSAKNMPNRSHRRGVESKLTYKINNSENFSISHDYVDSTEHNSTKNIQETEIRRPKNLVNLNFHKSVNNKTNFSTNILYSSKVKDTDFVSYPSRTVYLKDYFTFNSVINFSPDESNHLSLKLNNIFNRKYNEVYGYSTSGFEVFINYNREF